MTTVTEDFAGTGVLNASNWTSINTAGHVRSSGVCVGQSNNTDPAFWTANAFTGDQFAQITVVSTTAFLTLIGPLVKGDTTTGNKYYVGGSGSRLIVLKGPGAGSTILIDTNNLGGITVSPGDVVRLEISVNILTLKVNGATIGTYTDSSVLTGTRVGLHSYDGDPTVGSDNWSGGDLSSAATAVTMSGPSTGTVGVASTNFTVGANGTITGMVTVTPSDGGGGGTFTPTTVNISSGSPTATFTYTAASSGAKTISATNNGSLTAPTPLTYTASGGAATAITMSGPSGGAVGVASSNFTVGANGTITGTVTVTPSAGGGGGTFTPTTVNISSGSPTATFTYTPASAGAKTISATNNGSLTNPGNLTYTATTLPTFQSAQLKRNGTGSGPAVLVGNVTLTWLKLINRTTGADIIALKTNVAVTSSLFQVSDAGLTSGSTVLAFWRESTGEYGWGEAVVS